MISDDDLKQVAYFDNVNLHIPTIDPCNPSTIINIKEIVEELLDARQKIERLEKFDEDNALEEYYIRGQLKETQLLLDKITDIMTAIHVGRKAYSEDWIDNVLLPVIDEILSDYVALINKYQLIWRGMSGIYE